MNSDVANQLAALGRALSHPIRVRIVDALLRAEHASPRTLAQELRLDLGVVSYHVRFLADDGFLTLIRTIPRRGALQHFYALTPALRIALPAVAGTLEASPPGPKTSDIAVGNANKRTTNEPS